VKAQRFRFLLYAVSLGLLVIALRLGQRLWTRTLRIRRLVDANIIGIFIWDFEGRIIEANEAFLHMMGYDHDDLVAGRMRWTDLTPPDWRDRDARLIQEHKMTGSLQPFEKEYFRKDGSRVPVLIGVATFEEAGNQGVAFVLDLTERKRAEVVGQRLAAIVDSSEDAVVSKDLNGTIESWNGGAERLFGYQASEVIGKSILIIIPPDRHDEELGILERIRRGERIRSYETVRMRKDGGLLDISLAVSPLRDAAGRIIGASKIARDITERKRAEERLRVQHAVAQILAEAATIEEATPRILRAMGECLGWDVGALWRVDREAEALRCVELWHKASIEVPEFERVSREYTFVAGLGLPGRVWSSLEPKYIPDVVPDENFPRASIAEREGLHAAFGFPILLGGEVLGVIEFFSREIRQPDQELLNMLATIGSQIGQFIERKRAEKAFREMQLELAHANRVATMGQLSASIANKAKQPITAAVTYALAARRWLSADPPNFREVDDALSLIVKEGKRAGEVLGRTPALIKKAPARKDAVAINDAILEVIALTRTEAANNSVSVRTQLAEGLPRVQGDRVQLQQVLLNLIINAIEAMRDVGEKERELLISSRNERDGVSVEVRDSGPGFAPAALERVFEAFYTTKPDGLGMGLSICRSIIEAHNGRLWASPNLPRGASFQFALPAIANTAS
jgi:PAS domain S-box-containing protein